MTQIQPFTFPATGQAVRTLLVDGEPNFVAADICSVLAILNVSQAVASLDEDEKGVCTVDTPGGPQSMAVVNEPGLYSLILRSRKPEAKVFKRWVTHEVLPAIRKTGSYALAEPSRKDLALMILAAEEAREEAESRAALAEIQAMELAPAARAWDELAEATGDYSVREAALILDRDRTIKTGQGRLFRYLREIGWIDRHNVPYQRHVECGRVAIRTRTYEHPNRDEDVVSQQVRITPKGLGELHKLLGGQSQLPALVSEQVAA